MKGLLYNILYGCREQSSRKMLENFILENNFDLISFNEMNDWDDEEFDKFAKKLGFNYSYLFIMKSSPFFMGIASKYKIKFIYSNEDPPFHHGFFHVIINNINFIITHLSPHYLSVRVKEANWLYKYIKAVKGPIVLMGDLNQLSTTDAKYYETSNLFNELKNEPTFVNSHTSDNRLSYEPYSILINSGLVDINDIENELNYSVPTPIVGEVSGYKRKRIDYVLVNEIINKKNTYARVLNNDDRFNRISDHYPVIFNLDLS